MIDTYVSSAHELWPGEPEPRLHRSRGSGHVPGRAEVELLVLPNARAPRLLVPAHSPAAASRAMLRFSAALSGRDTVKRLGVSALLRARANAAFPDRITVVEGPESLSHYLAGVFGERVHVSLGLGTARANRKPVLQVFDARGRNLAFVKVGGTALTDTLVGAEAAALQRLGEAELPRLFEVPRLLHVGTWNGAAVVAMTTLETSFRQRPSRQFSVPVEAMSLLHRAFGDGARPLAKMPLWDSMLERQASLGPSVARERLAEALETLRDTDARPLAMGAWHGDWTPWNMSRRGRLQLWDWERFETGVPPGLDRCHYAVNAVCRRDGVDLASVLRGMDLAGIRNDRSTDAHVLGAAYLATITCRYLVGAEGELGGAIADRSLVMLDALCSWLGLPTGQRHG